MAQLARLSKVLQDTSGNATASASLAVYREGATVNGNQSGTSPTAFTVRHRGRVAASDSVFVNAVTGTTYTVDSVTATTITLSGFAGTLALTGGDRLVPSNSQPTLYADDQAGASTTNPLTSSATGVAACWIEEGVYELVMSGGGLTTTLYPSVFIASESPGVHYSGELDSASAVAHILDSRNAMSTAGAKLLSVRNATVEKASIDKDGDVACVDFAASGNATVAGTLGVTGLSTLASVTLNPGDMTVTAGDIDVLAGDVTTRRVTCSAGGGTAHVAGDYVLSAGWGDTATISPTCQDTRGVFAVTCGGAGIAANPTVALTFKDGTFGVSPTIICTRYDINAPATGTFVMTARSATACTFTFLETPVNTTIYSCGFHVIG